MAKTTQIVSTGHSNEKGHTAMIVVSEKGVGSTTYHCIKKGNKWVSKNGTEFNA